MNKKSAQTLSVAQLLIDKRYYTQSVHCSYYAVRQYIQYKLATTKNNPISYEEQKVKMNGKDSHEILLDEIRGRIQSPKECKSFTEEFRALKSSRVSADYSQHQFNDEEGCDCKAQAERLIKKIDYYKI